MAPRQKPVASLKRQRKQPDVEDWVFRFLGNLAALESMNSHKVQPSINLDRRREKSSLRRVRSPTPYSWAPVTDGMDSDEVAEQSLQPNNSRSRASEIANASATDTIDQHTLLERINHCIRVGIAEGKRRAERYVRKALSFALETGYLLPADREGKLLRVAPSLVHAVKPVAVHKASLEQAARYKLRHSSGRVEQHRGRRMRHCREKRFSRTRNAEMRAKRNEAFNKERENKRRRYELTELAIKRSNSSDMSYVQPRKSSGAHADGSSMSSNKEATDGAAKPAMSVDSEEVDRKPPLPVT